MIVPVCLFVRFGTRGLFKFGFKHLVDEYDSSFGAVSRRMMDVCTL